MNIIQINLGIILLLIPAIYQALPVLATKIAIHRVTHSLNVTEPGSSVFNDKIRVVKTETVESGSGVGSNIYLSLWYDCRKTDLVIDGNIPEMQHWSIVPYDIGTSYPLNSWVEKDSIITDIHWNYTVKMSSNQNMGDDENFIDVSESPIGLLLFRYTNPSDPVKAIESLPNVRSVQLQT